MTSSGENLTCFTVPVRSRSAAFQPMACMGWRTDVSGVRSSLMIGTSSYPTTAMSSGTATFRSRNVRITPRATMPLLQQMGDRKATTLDIVHADAGEVGAVGVEEDDRDPQILQ